MTFYHLIVKREYLRHKNVELGLSVEWSNDHRTLAKSQLLVIEPTEWSYIQFHECL